MLSRRIDRKDAGVLLYALQIASGNLKTMQAEKAMPTQVVVEVDKAGDTPIGMTPWSANGPGHDVDKASGGHCEKWSSLGRPPSAEECYNAMSFEERSAMTEGFNKARAAHPGANLVRPGPDSLLPEMQNLRELHERRSRA
jgi:hypothetical protein